MPNIQSLERAFFLLECLSQAGSGGMSLTDLSNRGGLKPPTCRNLLLTLQSLGYVRQLSGNRRYVLTGRATFPGATDFSAPLSAHALPLLQSLLAEVEETIIFCLYAQQQRRTLLALESQQQLKVSADVGSDRKFYCTATGRILLSLLPKAELTALLRHLPPPADDWPEFVPPGQRSALLAAIREKGEVHLDKGGMVTALAVPVCFSRRDLPPAAVGLYYPAARHPASRIQDFLLSLRHTAQKIAEF